MSIARRCGVALAAATALSVVPAAAANASAPAGNHSDVSFIRANGQTNLAEIALGRLALEKSGNPVVRHVATVTINDHLAAEAALAKVAAASHVALPKLPSPSQRLTAQHLETLSGRTFNLGYLEGQVLGHELSILDTKQEIAGGANPRARKYARYYLPVAVMHLKMSLRGLKKLA